MPSVVYFCCPPPSSLYYKLGPSHCPQATFQGTWTKWAPGTMHKILSSYADVVNIHRNHQLLLTQRWLQCQLKHIQLNLSIIIPMT
jgi:hypothetical protein